MLIRHNFTLGPSVPAAPFDLVHYVSGHAFQKDSVHRLLWYWGEADLPADPTAFLLAL